MSDRSKEQVIKEALSSSTRVISTKQDLEISFGSDSIQSNSIPLDDLSSENLALSRAKADKVALKEKFSFERKNSSTGVIELDQSLNEQNNVRIEILGSLQFKGLKNNLRKNFVDELPLFQPQSALESINKTLDIYFFHTLLKSDLCLYLQF